MYIKGYGAKTQIKLCMVKWKKKTRTNSDVLYVIQESMNLDIVLVAEI
jgi:accessory colonization factor AcfC